MQPELSADVAKLRDKIATQSYTEADIDALIAANTKLTQAKIGKKLRVHSPRWL